MHPAIKKGGVAVITGGGYGGIGYSLASTFSSHGLRLCLVDNDSASLSKAVSSLSLPESDILSIQADVSNFEDLKSAQQKVEDKFGKDSVRVLCLNAGRGGGDAKTWDGKMDTWTKTLGVNLFGVINGANAFTQSLVESKEPGLVIVTGSKQGITVPPATGGPYNVSKAGVKVFTEQLAHELREATQERVTAHLLIPGWTFTKLTNSKGSSEKPEGAWYPQQVVDYALPRIANGDFYLVCPDNDVTSELDKARMEWSANDVVQNRPALSRWHKDHKDDFEKFIKEKTGK